MYEVPYDTRPMRPRRNQEYREQLVAALTKGRRGEAVELFLRLVGSWMMTSPALALAVLARVGGVAFLEVAADAILRSISNAERVILDLADPGEGAAVLEESFGE